MGAFSRFKKETIKNAQGYGKTPYMTEPGDYKIRIVRHSIGLSKQNENAIKFVCEYEILQSACPDKHPIGSRRSYVVVTDPAQTVKAGTKIGAIKYHLSVVAGLEQGDIDQDFLDALEENPLKYEGVDLWLEVGEQTRLKDGTPFNPSNWYPCDEDDEEEAVEQKQPQKQEQKQKEELGDIPF